MHTSYVYIMQASEFMKIGVTSSSLIKRATAVQTGCPLPITDIKFFTFSSRSEAFEAEKTLHQRFKEYHIHGEWFVDFKSFGKKISKVLGKNMSETKFKNYIKTETTVLLHNRRNKIKLKRLEREKRDRAEAQGEKFLESVTDEDINNMSMEEHIKYMKKKRNIERQLRNIDKRRRKSEKQREQK